MPNHPTPKKKNLVRLNKFLALTGAASRRKSDELIEAGKVKVNGHVVRKMGLQITPGEDRVELRGRLVKPPEEMIYILFNKPKNVVTTLHDPEGRPSIKDYFAHIKMRLFPVGRLDWESEGLLLITNDGDFAQKITHPKENIPKTYHVKLSTTPKDSDLKKLVTGVSIIGGKVKALRAQIIPTRGSDKYPWVEIVISEGKNRQVRQMFQKIGCDVMKLQRVAIGELRLGKTQKGKYRLLGTQDLKKLFSNKPPEKPVRIKVKKSIKKSSRKV